MLALGPLHERGDARWVAPELLHVTLAFLGATPRPAVPALVEAIREEAAAFPPLDLSLGRTGTFDSREAAVLWVGLAAGRQEVAALAGALGARLRPGEEEGRRVRPHVTLARRAAREAAAAAADVLGDLRGLPWRAESIELVRSHLGPGAPRYETLAAFTLTGEMTAPGNRASAAAGATRAVGGPGRAGR